MPRWLRYGLVGVALCLLIAWIAASFYIKSLGPRLKARVEQALEDRFDADVELKKLEFTLFPHPQVTGKELTIRHKQWNDPHPLIYIRHFRAATDFSTMLDWRNRVTRVDLEGLEIHVPRRGRAAQTEGAEANQPVASAEPGRDTAHRLRFLIETIVANGTLLEIEPKTAGREPLQFSIRELTMHSVGPAQAMAFTAKLSNPKPPGLIDTVGRFGPWQRDDPRSTPVSGDYTFKNADLGIFKGISGILSSTGNYHGVLQHIEADGKTDTPRFALKAGGDPVHLVTSFHSVIDGTNGDTILDPVDATFLRSEFICRGGVVQKPGPKGKTVSLDAVSKHARIEDILTLVVGGQKPVLTGDVNFNTRIEIPPGQVNVLDKLVLNGKFGVLNATFTSSKLQRPLETLSHRALGISKKEEATSKEARDTVASNLRGTFRLRDGAARFSQITFRVPGALVSLAGTYNLRSEEIDMQGDLRMDAALSDTQSGFKHWMLKPFDPIFRKQGSGFVLPIVIAGTKDHPEISTVVLKKKIHIH
jgi:hypothetical protein